MKIFTKSLLTLVLFVLAVGVAKADDVIDFDASFYHSWDKVGKGATDGGVVSGGIAKIGEEIDLGGTIWGNQYGSVPYLCYANLTEYSELRFEGTPGAVIRIMCNRTVDEGPIFELKPTIGNDGKLTVKISDLMYLNGGTACDYVCLQSIKVPAGWQGGTTACTLTSMKLVKPSDPLEVPKENLKNAINKGKLQNSFAKTTASWNTLQDAIAAGEAELDNVSTTAELLAAATQEITDALAGLELQDGYTNLTTDMFKNWNDNNKPTTSTSAGCAYVLNESTGQPYGDGNVYYKNFADISDFNKLYVLVAAGQARIQMNRETDGGTTHIVYSSGVGVTEVDFATASELDGFDFVHLNAIKDNWGGVTVTGMYLYRTITVGDAGFATFGSLYKNAKPNDVTAYAAKYADGKVQLTPVTNVPAGKGVVIEAAAGSYAPTFDVAADDIDSDLLVSNGTVEGDGSTIYVLNKVNDKVGFYLLKEGNKLEAGKAYLKVENAARGFIGINGMDVTGISNVQKAVGAKNDKIYNLNGQLVNKARKGLFIKNGQKVWFD